MVAVGSEANLDSADDAAALARHASDLVDAIEATIGGWAERCVERFGVAPGDVGERTQARVVPTVRALLEQDVDAQRTNPLSIIRDAVAEPTAVLRAAGVAPVRRDDFAERAFPADVYDLSPAAFVDIDAALHEPGITWGAAKAHVILARRRREGKR
jgi:hypothetical protein